MANEEINKRTADYLLLFAKQLSAYKFDIELIGAKEAEAIFKKRVFNNGLDANGQKLFTRTKRKRLGAYSFYYGKKRQRAGRQVSKMDFQFTGDLFQATQVTEVDGHPTLNITNGKLSDIAGYLEEQQQTEIFTMGDSEISEIETSMLIAINRTIDKLLK